MVRFFYFVKNIRDIYTKRFDLKESLEDLQFNFLRRKKYHKKSHLFAL